MSFMEKGLQLVSGMFTSSAASKYHGLMNQGATCYLNSVLQVLFMTEEFREAVKGFVARSTFENPDTDRIDCHLKNVFDDLEERTAYTYNITRTLGIDRVFEQRDAAEYFEKILNLTSPEASKIFHGELRHTKECCVCHDVQTNPGGHFWHLPLALVDSCIEEYSVVDGIKNFFSTSNINGENRMYCDTCDDKADATLRSVMTHHPDVLVLLLKRFEFNYSYMAYVKIKCTVDVPSTLQIPENQTYELYAVVDHFGDLRGGHYTTTIKSDDGRWYNFDDTRVSVHHQPFQMDDQVEKSESAYLLFYKKKKMEDADTCTQDTSEMSTPEGLPLDINDNNQRQDAENIREKHEGEGEAEMSNDTAEFGEKESRDMDSSESTGVEIMKDDAEDIGRKMGAELREVLSEGTNLDENLEVQSNGRGGLDDVTQNRPCEDLVGDEQFGKGTKTSSNYLTKDDREYDGNNCKDQEVKQKDYGKQEVEENMQVNLEGDKEGKTGDGELTSGSRKLSGGKLNKTKDDQNEHGDTDKLYGGPEQQSEEMKVVKEDMEQNHGDHVEDQNNRRHDEAGQNRWKTNNDTQPDVRSGSHSGKRRMETGEMSKKGSKKSCTDKLNPERKNLTTDSLAKSVHDLKLSHTESPEPEPQEHKIVQYSNSAGLSNAEEMQNEPTTGLLFVHGKTSKEKGRRRWWHHKHPPKSDKKGKKKQRTTPGCFCFLKSRKNQKDQKDQMSD